MNRGRDLLNGEGPTTARHIPVKRIVVGKEPEGAIQSVGKHILVLTRRQRRAALAQAYTQAIGQLLQVVVFGLVIARQGSDFQMHKVDVAEAVAVEEREVPVDFLEEPGVRA